MFIKSDYAYSVMQSDENSFRGNFVWDSLNMAYTDEHRIYTKNIKTNNLGYLLQIFWILKVIEENTYLKKYST